MCLHLWRVCLTVAHVPPCDECDFVWTTFRFEPGGVVNQAFFLMLTNAAVTTIQVVQPGPLLQRYCFARLVVSQHRLNQLWAPPDMLLGELYASTIKTVALCLVYAPLWPPAYIVTALALLLNYVCTKFAVAYW